MIQIDRILCPVDFSDFSGRALDHAVAIARWYESAITVLHVTTPALAVAVGPHVGPVALQPVSLVGTDRKQLLADLRHLVAHEVPSELPVDVCVEDGMEVSREIVVQAQRLAADLIVLGTHGRSGFERLFLGSVAEKVLRRASCPVMTVPRAVPDAVPVGACFRRILCALDFSSSSITALNYAMSLAQEADAELTVLHSVELLPDLTEPPLSVRFNAGELVQQSRQRLTAMVPDAIRQYCRVTEQVGVGKAYRDILRLAAHQAADLIVMGVQGRGALDALLFGSTTQHVVRQAACPVLTVRAAGD